MRITQAEWMKLKVTVGIAKKFMEQLPKADQFWLSEAIDSIADIEDRLSEANAKAAAHMKDVRRAKAERSMA